jgi:hypothetical protein
MHRDTHTFTILTPHSFFHFPHTHDRALLEKYYLSIRAQAGAGGGGGGGGGDGNGNGGGGRGSGIRRFLVVSPEERERQQRERAWRELQRQHNDYNARLEALDTASTPLSKLEGFGGKRAAGLQEKTGIGSIEELAKVTDADCIPLSKLYVGDRDWQVSNGTGFRRMRDQAADFVATRRQRLLDNPPPPLPPRPNPPPGGNGNGGDPYAGGSGGDDDLSIFGAFDDPDGYGGLIVTATWLTDLSNYLHAQIRDDLAGRVRSVLSEVWSLDWTRKTANLVSRKKEPSSRASSQGIEGKCI